MFAEHFSDTVHLRGIIANLQECTDTLLQQGMYETGSDLHQGQQRESAGMEPWMGDHQVVGEYEARSKEEDVDIDGT